MLLKPMRKYHHYEYLDSIIANKVASSGFLDFLSVKLKLIVSRYGHRDEATLFK